jgi:hypothetical protein|tara:strand:- start:2315 stop:3265 length:951 start_codon:yes stop_codon:yes gene_type:complete
LVIFGAGLAGLLSGNILRNFNPKIWEAQSSLPNNHEALLRFRTDRVGTSCAIPFQKVDVNKAVKYGNELSTVPDLFLSNLYSQKVTGGIWSRSINNLSPASRYIAPLDLISQMSEGCEIECGRPLSSEFLEEHKAFDSDVPIISTIPMPALMKIIDWGEVPEFKSQKIWTQRATIESPECGVYQTIYYPDKLVSHYRASVVGQTVIVESICEPDRHAGQAIMEILRDDFGIEARRLTDIHSGVQRYGKIMPIDEGIRQRFIFEMTTRYNLYSVGRFATWRQLLLDDVVEDIQKVEQFIRGNSDYRRKIKSQKGADQ